MNRTLSVERHVLPIQVDDQLRQLGALIDIVVSLTMFASAIVASVATGSESAVVVAAIFAGFWVADIALYAGFVAGFGGSLGNLVTSRRVVDAATGERLPFRRAVRRYFARRRLLRWFIDLCKREAANPGELPEFSPYSGTTNPMAPYGHLAAFTIVGLMNRTGRKKTPRVGPTASVADRGARSAVVRTRSDDPVSVDESGDASDAPVRS